MLILFDVDGTLLLSKGAGVKAMTDAGRSLFGDSFTFTVDCAGLLDPIIWSMLAANNDIADTPENHDRFRRAYATFLRQRFESDPTAALLPGVGSLIDRLRGEVRCTLGLLTGNYAETGRLKIRTAGLDPDIFTIAAWGDEAPRRRDLPAVAIRRYEQAVGMKINRDRVVVIGDTPHDIDCARANGCLAVGVATGPSHSLEDLLAHEPDLLLEDLTDTAGIVDWLLTAAARVTQ